MGNLINVVFGIVFMIIGYNIVKISWDNVQEDLKRLRELRGK